MYMSIVTDAQVHEAVAAWRDFGSQVEAAKHLGLTRAAFRHRLCQADVRGIDTGRRAVPLPAAGFIVHEHSVSTDKHGNVARQSIKTRPEPGPEFEMPPAHMLSGQTTQVDRDGRVTQAWFKTRTGDLGRGLVEALQSVFSESIVPVELPISPPYTIDGRLTFYPVTDLHYGMYSWGQETGEDYDLKIADRSTRRLWSDLIGQSPPHERALIAIMGDVLHANDQTNQTQRSKHQLDVDGRYSKVLWSCLSALRHVIDCAAAHHEYVHVEVNPGNHDPDAAKAIHLALRTAYEVSDRVTIGKWPRPISYYAFGATLIGTSHGHTAKPNDLAHAMAADMREAWSKSLCQRIYIGHGHRRQMWTHGSVVVEMLPAPAPRDAFAHAGGYRGESGIDAIHFDRKTGQIGRHTVFIPRTPVEQVMA